jgi:hypothetical protein
MNVSHMKHSGGQNLRRIRWSEFDDAGNREAVPALVSSCPIEGRSK